MGEDEGGPAQGRRDRWRYGPLRLILPWVAIAFGAVQTVRAASGEISEVFLFLGPALVALGIIAFFIYRWMAKRGV